MSNEASLFLVFFTESWPPAQQSDVEVGPTPVGQIALRMFESGSIGVLIRDDDGERLAVVGQPVKFTGRPAMILNVTVTEDGVTLRVNGTQVLPTTESEEVLTVESAETTETTHPPSIVHADAALALRERGSATECLVRGTESHPGVLEAARSPCHG